ncbi:MAG: MBL fold metallo-hydrolase [Candidatus Micrarchaeota archaeon]|nr:MBL fold metallo-hydrolase [Candidatus Micrarchaeota archaeon]
MKVSFFGGAGEVGRSCILVKSDKSKILLDAGVKLGAVEEYPQIRDSDLKGIDGIFISHAHLDHFGYLPHIFTAGYRGKVYATKPTIELINIAIRDYMNISKPKNVTSQGLAEMAKHFEIIEYGKPFRLKDLTIKVVQSGHILGSAITTVSDGKHTIMYSGDMNMAQTRLLPGADMKNARADTLIIESTYGAKNDIFPPEKEVSQKLMASIKETLHKGGKVIIPTFGVGRAQEVLFMLDDFMNSGILPKAPIYISGVINKIMRIHRHNVIYCRREVQMRILMSDSDPFKSKNFVPVESNELRGKIVKEKEASIIVTTSGMLTGGPVMYYLARLARDPMNKLILVGYQAEGTLGRALQEGAREVTVNRAKVKVNLTVETFHLSAHADRKQLEAAIAKVHGLKNVFVVHGEKSKSEDLRMHIANKYNAIVPEPIKEYHV